jgi:predicted DCC family thiol-disulfide oxidoreductase YuxK
MKLRADPDNNSDAKPVVFYDGGCPYCSREINHYRKLDRRCNIDWVDITKQPQLLDRYGLTKDQAMQRFHVLDQGNQWHIGSYGFALMWSRLPGYRWLSAVLERFGLLGLLDKAYNRFAQWRLKRRNRSQA